MSHPSFIVKSVFPADTGKSYLASVEVIITGECLIQQSSYNEEKKKSYVNAEIVSKFATLRLYLRKDKVGFMVGGSLEPADYDLKRAIAAEAGANLERREVA